MRYSAVAAAIGSVEHASFDDASPDIGDIDAEVAEAERSDPRNYLSVFIPMKLRRRGVETKLITDAPDNGGQFTEPDPALVKMIANAHQWWEDLMAPRFPTMRALASAYGKDERYVARVLQLAFLAPTTVDAIVAGNQPIEMTAQGLITMPDLSPSWGRQKDLLLGSSGS